MEYFIGFMIGAILVFFGLYLPTRYKVAELEYTLLLMRNRAREVRQEIEAMREEYQSDDVPWMMREQAE